MDGEEIRAGTVELRRAHAPPCASSSARPPCAPYQVSTTSTFPAVPDEQ